MKRNPAIYAIRHIESNRIYVGSSVNYLKRWRYHIADLNHSKHHSSKLQNAWNKYGRDAFDFYVLEYIENVDSLFEAEQRWFNKLCPFYNCAQIAGSNIGLKRSAETRQKMREASKHRKLTSEQIANLIRVNTGRRFTRSEKDIKAMSERLTGKRLSPEHIEAIKRGHARRVKAAPRIKLTPLQVADAARARATKTYEVTAPDGTVTLVTDMKAFCSTRNLHQTAMYQVAKGKFKQHKGWSCIKIDDHSEMPCPSCT